MSSSGEKPPEIIIHQSVQQHGAEARVQFAPSVRPGARYSQLGGDDAVSSSGQSSRKASVIPQVLSEKDRRRREKDSQKQQVNIDEHLMAHASVAERYHTQINMDKPGASTGLTTQKAESLLVKYGANILTPPKKRHPFLQYLDYLSSLFNLLLIVAGILEYILLGIDFKGNFQNVSLRSHFHPLKSSDN